MLRYRYLLPLLIIFACARAGYNASPAGLRRQLTELYERERQAMLRSDTTAVMELRTADVHTIAPDGSHGGRERMQRDVEQVLGETERWHELSFTIDSVEVTGDTARLIVRKAADRDVRGGGRVRRVQVWSTERDTWLRTTRGWLLWRVDGTRDERRLVDGREG